MAEQLTDGAGPAPPRRRRWVSALAKAVLGLLLFLIVAIGAFGLLLDTDLGHRLILDRIAALAPSNGLRIRIGRIEGSIWGETELRDLRLYDQDGLFAEAPVVALDWRPFAWFANRLVIDSIASELVIVHRAPHLIATARAPLPRYDVHIGRLDVAQLRLDPAVAGRRRVARLSGQAEFRAGRFLLDVDAAMRGGGDRLALLVDAAPDRDRLDLRLRLDAPAEGVLARMIGARAPLSVELGGAGSWARWDGSAHVAIAGRPSGDLRLAARSGHYGASGWLAPSALLEGQAAALAAPRVNVSADGRLDDGVLTGSVAARSAAMRLALRGGANLGRDRFDDVRIAFELLRPLRLGPQAAMSGGRLQARLDGPFADGALSYRLTVPRLDLGGAALEQLQASGSGRWSHARLAVPISAHAATLSASDGTILADVNATGTLVLAGDRLTTERIAFSSQRLRGTLGLEADLASGRYALAGNAAGQGYSIAGLGVADLEADFRLASAAGDAQLTGRARGALRRIDDAALGWTSGGDIRFEADFATTPGGGLRFTDAAIASPALQLRGNGDRGGGGGIRFAAAGRQRTLGPLAVTFDGSMERPHIGLRLARPGPGLADVRVDVAPAGRGYGWRAQGRSSVGRFVGNGSVAMHGGPAISIAALSVSGAHASGVLRPAGGAVSGRLDFHGTLAGPLLFAPGAGGGQRIETHLLASDARLGAIPLGSGRLDAALEIGASGSLAGGLRFAGVADRLWGLSGIEAVRLSGPLSAEAQLAGTLADPRGDGSARLDGARLVAGGGSALLRDIDARASFDAGRLTLASLTGRTEGGGNVSAAGTIGFGGATDLRIEARSARFAPSEGLSARVSGPIRIISAGDGGAISGDLTIDGARIRLGGGGGTGGGAAFGSNWRLALTVTGEDLAVAGRGLDSEWRARVRVAGTLASPAVFGEATLVEGTYTLLGRSFALSEGTARFAGDVDPELDIVARPAGGLPLRITGRASRPQIGLVNPLSSSEPSPPPAAFRPAEAGALPPRRWRRSA